MASIFALAAGTPVHLRAPVSRAPQRSARVPPGASRARHRGLLGHPSPTVLLQEAGVLTLFSDYLGFRFPLVCSVLSVRTPFLHKGSEKKYKLSHSGFFSIC